MTRVISIGLDGAAWHKLDRLMADGRVPNLQELVETGVRAPLRTVTPPVTCPAWRCSTSGKNPGKLGVFWWLNLDHDTRVVSSPDSNSFTTADIWDYLSDDGYRCAVVNVPMTYPPSELNGTMVSGFGASLDFDLDPNDSITHPPEFESELVSEYDWEVGVEDITTHEGLEQTYDLIRSRFELLLDLIEEDYDFVHLTVFYINMLQHKYGDSQETDHAWELIDQYLGRIDTEDTLLILYSDHGHETIEQTFVINRWLVENGYLSLDGMSDDTAALEGLYSALLSAGVSPKKLAVLLRRLLPDAISDRIIPSSYPISVVQLANQVDWEETQAVALSQGPLYINRKLVGDEYKAFRDKLQKELKSVEHEGEHVLSDVRTAEEVYRGLFVDDAPDLLLYGSEGWEVYGGIVPSMFETQVMSWTSGNHPVGTLVLNGPGVEPGELEEQSILDIVPTILNYFGSPIPRDMDGTVIRTAFPDREMRTREREPLEASGNDKRTDDEELQQRLGDLGYLE